MKKMALVLAAILVVCLAAMPASAMDPVSHPPEGHVVVSTTAVEMQGDFILDQDYSQEVCRSDGEVIVTVHEDCCDPGNVVFRGPINVDAGFAGYKDENDAIDGIISFRKDFVALGQPDDFNDNVVAVKDVGYAGSGPTSYYEAEETGDIGVWQSSGLGIHWDVANQGGEETITISTTLENDKERHIALGSEMFVTSVSAHTETGLNLLGNRVSAAYDIGAIGLGTVGADLAVGYREDNISEMGHTEHTVAIGAFEFAKAMEVNFDVEPVAVDPFNTLAPICPFVQAQGEELPL